MACAWQISPLHVLFSGSGVLEKRPVPFVSKQDVPSVRREGWWAARVAISVERRVNVAGGDFWVVCRWGAMPATVGRGPCRLGRGWWSGR